MLAPLKSPLASRALPLSPLLTLAARRLLLSARLRFAPASLLPPPLLRLLLRASYRAAENHCVARSYSEEAVINGWLWRNGYSIIISNVY